MNNYFRFCDLKHGEMILCIMMYRESLTIFAAVVLSLWVDSQQLCKDNSFYLEDSLGQPFDGLKVWILKMASQTLYLPCMCLKFHIFFSCHAICPNEITYSC